MTLGNTETDQVIGKDINVKANGITICYDDLGEGPIPIIFIHGFPFDKSTWKPQIEQLKSSHRVIAYDIRGFGKSEAGNEEISISLFSDDLIKLMDTLQINKSIICGLSMGGYIALNAIHRYPKRFEAVILCDTQCIADSSEAKERRMNTIHQIETTGLNDFAQTFSVAVFAKDSVTDKSELVEGIKKIILSTAPETISKTLKALAQRWEMCSFLNEISVPTLILCGKEDAVTPIDKSDYMSKNIPDSKFFIIDQAGHVSNLEQPAQFNAYLRNFISGIENMNSVAGAINVSGFQTPHSQ